MALLTYRDDHGVERRLVKDAVVVEALPPAKLKGKSAAVPIFRVVQLR